MKSIFCKRFSRLGLIFLAALPSSFACAEDSATTAANSGYLNFYTGKDTANDKGIDWVKSIAIFTPAYGSEVQGDVAVKFSAPGMTKAKAMCWQEPTTNNSDKWGHDETVVSDIKLDALGNGIFVFPADKYPNGPITLRIYAKDDTKKQDLCELQLYNEGGIAWKQGIPQSTPPGTSWNETCVFR